MSTSSCQPHHQGVWKWSRSHCITLTVRERVNLGAKPSWLQASWRYGLDLCTGDFRAEMVSIRWCVAAMQESIGDAWPAMRDCSWKLLIATAARKVIFEHWKCYVLCTTLALCATLVLCEIAAGSCKTHCAGCAKRRIGLQKLHKR